VCQLQKLFADRQQLAKVRSEAAGLRTFMRLFSLAAATGCLLLLSGPSPVGVPLAVLAFCFPLTYLYANPELQTALD
jgi:hypothetical protein